MAAATAPPEQAPAETPDAAKTTEELFRFSAYVHAGTDSDRCDFAKAVALPTGDRPRPLPLCENPDHFHAWCRLPNQFQDDDIRKRARAARARRIRQLRDPQTDAYVVLEADMEDLLRTDDRQPIIDALLFANDPQDRYVAMRDTEATEEFEHRQADLDRLREIRELPEDQQSADELKELERQSTRYADAVQERIEEIRKPRAASLEGLNMAELIDQYRDQRIEDEGRQAYLEFHAMYEMFVCTFKPSADGKPRQRSFADLAELAIASPEVIVELRNIYDTLESSFTRGLVGNF